MKSSRLTPYLLSVLRLVAAFVYVAHGTQKIFGVPGHPYHAPVFAATMMGAAGVIETIGGMLMLLGLFTRPVAFVLSGALRRFVLEMNSVPEDAESGDAEVAAGAVDQCLSGYAGLQLTL